MSNFNAIFPTHFAVEGGIFTFELEPISTLLLGQRVHWEIIFNGDNTASREDIGNEDGIIEFEAGETESKFVSIPIPDNDASAGDKTFSIRIFTIEGDGFLLSETQIGPIQTITIIDDETQLGPDLSIASGRPQHVSVEEDQSTESGRKKGMAAEDAGSINISDVDENYSTNPRNSESGLLMSYWANINTAKADNADAAISAYASSAGETIQDGVSLPFGSGSKKGKFSHLQYVEGEYGRFKLVHRDGHIDWRYEAYVDIGTEEQKAHVQTLGKGEEYFEVLTLIVRDGDGIGNTVSISAKIVGANDAPDLVIASDRPQHVVVREDQATESGVDESENREDPGRIFVLDIDNNDSTNVKSWGQDRMYYYANVKSGTAETADMAVDTLGSTVQEIAADGAKIGFAPGWTDGQKNKKQYVEGEYGRFKLVHQDGSIDWTYEAYVNIGTDAQKARVEALKFGEVVYDVLTLVANDGQSNSTPMSISAKVIGADDSTSYIYIASSGGTTIGTSADEFFQGSDSDDWFDAVGGDDVFIGGKGDDRVFLNSGDDVALYRYESNADANGRFKSSDGTDIIYTFERGKDKLILLDMTTGSESIGSLDEFAAASNTPTVTVITTIVDDVTKISQLRIIFGLDDEGSSNSADVFRQLTVHFDHSGQADFVSDHFNGNTLTDYSHLNDIFGGYESLEFLTSDEAPDGLTIL